MALTAACIFFMDRRAVRLPMAFLAGRKLGMGRMAFCAGNSGMFCYTGLQKPVGLVMTTCTDLTGLTDGIGYPQRGMDRVASLAIGHFEACHGAVVLMAFIALRNTAVCLRMTGGTFLLGMHTDLSLEAGSHFNMTGPAPGLQVGRHRDGIQGLMWIGMAFQAFHYSL